MSQREKDHRMSAGSCTSVDPLKLTHRFRGSDDDLRARFEEYICSALSAIKLEDFVRKGKQSDIAIVGIGTLYPQDYLIPISRGEYLADILQERNRISLPHSRTPG